MSQQNCVVGRQHQHILNVTHSIMHQFDLPKIFHSYAIIHIVYIINRLSSSILENKIHF